MSDDNTIYFLSDYEWLKGELVSEGRKNYKVREYILQFHKPEGEYIPFDTYIPKHKCAFPGEKVCVVWERWKGKNGRGGYRVERELYPEQRVLAEEVSRQPIFPTGKGRVDESEKLDFVLT